MSNIGQLPGRRTGRTVTPRSILYSVGSERMKPGGVVMSSTGNDGGNTGYTDEIREGWMLGAVTSTKERVPLKLSLTNGAGNASTSLVVDNSAAFKAGDTIQIGGNQTMLIGAVADDDSAASNGTALYLHIDELGESPFGHLESVTANNADSTFSIGNGGPVVKVEDDDAAATGGVQIYFDEDAANLDERFLAAVPTGKDAFILASDGRAIRIKYHATPSTPGVAVYFDDNGSNVYERLLFVSPTNAAGTYHTDDTLLPVVGYATRSASATVSSVNHSTNTITLSGAVTWADGDMVLATDGSGVFTGEILAGFTKLTDADNQARDAAGNVYISGAFEQSMLLGDAAALIATKSVLAHKVGDFQFYSSNERTL